MEDVVREFLEEFQGDIKQVELLSVEDRGTHFVELYSCNDWTNVRASRNKETGAVSLATVPSGKGVK